MLVDVPVERFDIRFCFVSIDEMESGTVIVATLSKSVMDISRLHWQLSHPTRKLVYETLSPHKDYRHKLTPLGMSGNVTARMISR